MDLPLQPKGPMVIPAREESSKEPPPAPEGSAPSKNALKKAQKEKEKAEKKAARAAQEQQEKAASQTNDTAKGLYGQLPESESLPELTKLSALSNQYHDEPITFQARVHNARVQSAKLAFLMLREQGKKIQAVVAEGKAVSRQMVKWAGGIHINSVVLVTGVVEEPVVPVSSADIEKLEIRIERIYMVDEAAQQLPVQVKDLERPPPEGAEEGQLDAEGAPVVTLATRLDNPTLNMQTSANQAIMKISSGVAKLFTEFMWQHDFTQIFSAKMQSTATEGGSGVFEVNYFGGKACLAQSPQLGKQMCIAGDLERVFEIGPVFRAENSNTHRHMTEVSLP